MPSVVNSNFSPGSVTVAGTNAQGQPINIALPAVVSVNLDGSVNTGTGGGGGGGGGAVTAADGALVAIGATTDAATATTLVGLNKALLAAAVGPTPAGTNVIGAVTSPTLLAAINAPTPAGANAIGTVGVTANVAAADVVTTPTINTGTLNTYAEFPAAGANEVSLEVTNLPAGAVLTIQRRVGSTVYGGTALPAGVGNAYVSTINANGVYHFLGGGQFVRLTVTTAAAGTANLTWVGSAGQGVVSAKQSNPANFYASAVADARLNDGAGNLLGVQFAPISAAAAGSNIIVAAVAGKRIKVLGLFVLSSAANTATFQDGSTPITGALPFLANQGLSETTTPYGLFATSSGNALTLNLSAAAAVVGHLSYVTY